MCIYQPLDGYWDFGVAGSLLYPCLFGLFVGWAFRSATPRNVSVAIIAVIFITSFFQSLVAIQFIISSTVSVMAGAWVALKAISMASSRTEETYDHA